MTNWKERIEEIKKDYDFVGAFGEDAANELVAELTNLITEILDSCPLREQDHHDFTQDSTVHDTTVITMFLKNREVDGYNEAVAEFEKWKEEVLG